MEKARGGGTNIAKEHELLWGKKAFVEAPRPSENRNGDMNSSQ